MELAEVVNPHFAFPVVGVVLCAVLVFAFGFKSSAEPPSFDFDEEKKAKKQQAKRDKKKVQTNGHVPGLETQASKPASPASRSSVGSHKVQPAEQVRTPKVKKSVVTPKATPKQPPKQKEDVTEDVGGWTTAVTKKKQKKTRKDGEDFLDAPPSPQPQSAARPTTPTTKVEAPEVTVTPREQRKKDRSPPKKEVNAVEYQAELQISQEKNDKTADDAMQSPKKTGKKTVKGKAGSSPMQVVAAPPTDHSSTASSKVATDSTLEPATAASPKASTGDAIPILDAVAPEEAAAAPTPKASSKTGKSSPKKDVSSPPLTAKDEESFMEVKTKTGKKKKSKQDSGGATNTDTSPVKDAPDSSPVEVVTTQKSPSIGAEVASASNSTPQSETTSSGPTAAASFDEMGDTDWQEAKPVKRKPKKARREN